MFAQRYYDTILEPLLMKYRSTPNDDDLAYALAALLEQVVDHIRIDTGRSLNDIRKSLQNRYTDFIYLRTVAISTKNVFTDNIPGLNVQTRDLVELEVGPRTAIQADGSVQQKADSQTLIVTGQRRMFRFKDGKEIPVADLLEESFRAITDEINSVEQ
ncbi:MULTISPECIES: hypothetical protein [unclassified Roseovarius]|uniref:hypothetical protein n=1 Tax=unclassified Roseovarius TaxID=2614913 RepID=UPI00273FF4B1|nr:MULTISPECIES: hypothetical protein [unclassified Roseovarius]